MMTNGHEPRQYWLSRMQIINWGVFDGYHDIDFTRRGTLLTGSSGAGKSSLLDALSVAFLAHRRRNFNASSDNSNGGASPADMRSVDKYIRGMVGDIQNPGERAKKKYLREAGAAWSAIAVTYSGTDGSAVTGMVLKWLGAGEDSHASSYYCLINEDADIRDLCNEWATNRFSKNVLAEAGWQGKRDEKWYLDRLYDAIGLRAASSALDLLGKAKSLKSVGGLEQFVREYMLDEPKSLRELTTALEQISPLVDARNALAVAVSKRDTLDGIEENLQTYVSEAAQLSTIDLVERHMVGDWVDEQRLARIDPKVDQLDTEINRIGEECEAIAGKQRVLQAERDAIVGRINTVNGDLAPLRASLERATEHTQEVGANRSAYTKLLWDLDYPDIDSAEDFQSLRAESINATSRIAGELQEIEARLFEVLAPRKKALADQQQAAADELKRVETKGISVPPNQDRMRMQIAEALGLNPTQLPYVCELLDLKADRQRWRKAVEKVLRAPGLALLVPERHHRAALRYVNDHNMRGYLRIQRAAPDLPFIEPRDGTLADCLKLTDPKHECARAALKLISAAGSYSLVDSPDEFPQHSRAVTDQGLRKENDERADKDDREDLRPSQYIYQGNIADKIEALRDELAEAQANYAAAATEWDEVWSRREALRTQNQLWASLAQYDQFSKIDTAGAEAEQQRLQQQLDALMQANPDLEKLEKQAEEYREQIGKLSERIGLLKSEETRFDVERTQLLDLKDRLRPSPIGDRTRAGIESYLPQISQQLDLLKHEAYVAELWRTIQTDQEKLKESVRRLRGTLERIIKNFDDKFPESIPNDSSALDERVHDYVKLWQRIKDRDIQEAEEEMLRLITEQAPSAILRLHQLAEEEERQIREQIARVNIGLGAVEFAPGTRLKLEADPKPLTAVLQFREIAQRIADRIPAVSMGDEKAIFAQYEDILELRNRLASDTAEDRQWKTDAMDVRNRFVFYCAELFADSQRVKTTYTNASAKSGGEQEKLMAFCLAGALSYNLADHDTGDNRPVFAQLMIDEAFSKSDPDFARQSLSAFRRFGFQLVIVATVQNTTVIQPYIDSVVMVSKDKVTERASTQTVTVHRLAEIRKDAAAAAAEVRA